MHFGTGIYANTNLTMVDDGHIYVSNRVLFGPNVIVTTANHPLDPDLRRYEMQYNRDVHIGENVWIAAILAGVNIGRNTVIGAHSVVTRDIPDNVLAVGNPCRVIREIGEYDREYYYRDEKIDWENYEHLLSLGVDAEYHCYGDADNELKHVFHIDIKLPEARACNEDECSYFMSKVKAN